MNDKIQYIDEYSNNNEQLARAYFAGFKKEKQSKFGWLLVLLSKKQYVDYYIEEQEDERRRRKFAWLFFLLFFMLFGTTLSFNYWDGNINPINSHELNIGFGATLEVYEVITPSTDERLVPENVFMGENDVVEIILSYTAILNKALSVDLSDILIDGQEDIYNLIKLDVYITTPNLISQPSLYHVLEEDETFEDYRVTVNVSIKLREPEDETQYNYVSNKSISFTLEFTAEEVE